MTQWRADMEDRKTKASIPISKHFQSVALPPSSSLISLVCMRPQIWNITVRLLLGFSSSSNLQAHCLSPFIWYITIRNQVSNQYIKTHDKEQFRVSEEAKEFLSQINERVGVISVAGRYRTGKSFLLNRVIINRRNCGFGVGPTINPCTKGLWLWGDTLEGEY